MMCVKFISKNHCILTSQLWEFFVCVCEIMVSYGTEQWAFLNENYSYAYFQHPLWKIQCGIFRLFLMNK
jgi:hypothetical protein